MTNPVVILGAGGFAREVVDVVEACQAAGQDFELLGYIVEAGFGTPGTLINDKPILGGFEWFEQAPAGLRAICGVGDPFLRRRLVRQTQARGVRFCSIVHPTAVLTRWITQGDGVVITAGCILTNQIQIGHHVHLNLDCTIGHDVVLADFATLAPGVHVSGSVTLAEGCYVGTGANIIERRQIGAWSVVGAGSTVVQDVPPLATVVGVPGKVIKFRTDDPRQPSAES